MMDPKAILWTIVLCAGLIVWLYLDINSMHINYDWHSYLINSTTGEKIKPKEMIDLGKIINQADSYLNATNPIERLYDLEFQTNLENPFALDQVYTFKEQLEQSGWPVANQTSCSSQLDWIQAQLRAHSDYPLLRGRLGHELTQLMDSFGKPESGFYSGTVTWLGSYKQCKDLSLHGGSIRTRYCLARMKPKWWPNQEATNTKTRVRVGICIPETCDTRSFAGQREKIDWLIKLELNEFMRNNLELDSMFCLPDERSPLRQLPKSGQIYLLVVACWLAIVFFASILYEHTRRRQRNLVKLISFNERNNPIQQEQDELIVSVQRKVDILGSFLTDDIDKQKQQEQERRQQVHSRSLASLTFKLLQALSIHNSLKTFKSNAFLDEQKKSKQIDNECKIRVDLSSLSSIKFLMAIAVVLAHSSYLTSIYARSLSNRIDMNIHASGRMVLSVSRCVDTFFIFFGVLTAYTLLRKFTVKQLSNPFFWIGINLGILLRITPVFMLAYWFSRSISPYLGEGPWWDYGVFRYSLKGNCMQEPWWKSIPYFGCSGSPPVASCVLPSWFLVSYSQISLLMPIVTYLMCKLPGHFTKGLLLLFISIISGLQLAVKMYKQTSFKEEALFMYGGFLADLVEKFESTGTMATLGRVGCVSVGCYTGYLLRMYELGKIREWPGWFRSRLTTFIVFLMHILIVFLPLIAYHIGGDQVSTMDAFVSSYVTTMIVWPILNAILLINAVTVFNRTALVRFASHSFWHSANKLGLSIYLVHWEIIFLGITSFEQAPSMGFITDVFKMWAFGVFFSVLLAFLIHILIDAPISALLMALAKLVQEKFLSPPAKEEKLKFKQHQGSGITVNSV